MGASKTLLGSLFPRPILQPSFSLHGSMSTYILHGQNSFEALASNFMFRVAQRAGAIHVHFAWAQQFGHVMSFCTLRTGSCAYVVPKFQTLPGKHALLHRFKFVCTSLGEYESLRADGLLRVLSSRTEVCCAQ